MKSNGIFSGVWLLLLLFELYTQIENKKQKQKQKYSFYM